MSRRKPIRIGCPQHRKLVSGSYDCDARGRYALGPDQDFLLERVRCNQDEGRCTQTLCVLHRFNRGGPGSWYPDKIMAMPEPKKRPPGPPGVPKRRRSGPAKADDDATVTDILC